MGEGRGKRLAKFVEQVADPWAPGRSLKVVRRGVVGVDAEGALFVDVGVAHGYYYRVDGDVHHYYVENLEPDAE